MCEPNHSINQFPDDPDLTPKVQSAFQKVTEWAKKVGSWFHFSKMGMGHSESIRYGKNQSLYIPEPTRYEAKWWFRRFERDGSFIGSDGKVYREWGDRPPHIMEEMADAFDSARIYADQVCLGSLSAFRRFFETSVQKSNYANLYFEQFRSMLNTEGRLEMDKKLKFLDLRSSYFSIGAVDRNKDAMTKICMGLTRKRGLLIPEWADDNKLWLPAGA